MIGDVHDREHALIQEWLNVSAPAVVAQGRKSGKGTECFYRGPNGGKCAIGHLIDDQLAEKGDRSDTGAPLDKLAGGSIYLYEFLVDLQSTHDYADDGATFAASFKENICDLCTEYQLENPLEKDDA